MPSSSDSDNSAWLIVGLGNIGKRYIGTRHNIGFDVLDAFLNKQNVNSQTRKQWNHSESLSFKLGSVTLIGCWPNTFMNLSGDAVQELAAFYRVSPQHMIVIHDDIDLPCGKLRLRQGGGDGGQKGVRSTIERTGSADFVRIKVGVGRPADPRFEIADWVLSRFSKEESSNIATAIASAGDAIVAVIQKGLKEAQNQFNRDSTETISQK